MRVKTGVAAIDDLDVECIVLKLMGDEDPNAWNRCWDRGTAEGVAELYRSFLYLRLKYPEEIIIPTREIDEFWHLHILFTRKYHEDCNRIFGRYLHHHPHVGRLDTEEHLAFLDKHRAHTHELVRKEFPYLA